MWHRLRSGDFFASSVLRFVYIWVCGIVQENVSEVLEKLSKEFFAGKFFAGQIN